MLLQLMEGLCTHFGTLLRYYPTSISSSITRYFRDLTLGGAEEDRLFAALEVGRSSDPSGLVSFQADSMLSYDPGLVSPERRQRVNEALKDPRLLVFLNVWRHLRQTTERLRVYIETDPALRRRSQLRTPDRVTLDDDDDDDDNEGEEGGEAAHVESEEGGKKKNKRILPPGGKGKTKKKAKSSPETATTMEEQAEPSSQTF